jgi:hypothetical protein
MQPISSTPLLERWQVRAKMEEAACTSHLSMHLRHPKRLKIKQNQASNKPKPMRKRSQRTKPQHKRSWLEFVRKLTGCISVAVLYRGYRGPPVMAQRI